MKRLIVHANPDLIIQSIIDDGLNPQTIFKTTLSKSSLTTLLESYLSKEDILSLFKATSIRKEINSQCEPFRFSLHTIYIEKKPHYILIVEESDHSSDYLSDVIRYTPGYMYLKNTKFQYILCNDNFAKASGLCSPKDIIGKTDYDLAWGKTEADLFRKGDIETLSGIKKINFEENQYQADGKTRIVLANKIPLYDTNHSIIGILGNYLDITERKQLELELEKEKIKAEIALKTMKQAELKEQKQRKEVEHVKLENLAHKAQLEAQTQITNIAHQVAHDIRSPLASLLMILNSCTELPEEKRISLRAVSTRIGDIANNLLNEYKDKRAAEHQEATQAVLVSATLMQLVTEKRFQYQGVPVKLDCRFSENSAFAFIKTALSSFQRMVSNLINNAIDALEGKPGAVTLRLDATKQGITLDIQDTGKGIPQALLKKIKQRMLITEGKINGHGIGLGQVYETLEASNGKMEIESDVGKGTCFKLTFPRINAPAWCAENIGLNPDDIVLILDDDYSIHSAWDIRFEPLLKASPSLSVHHFEQGDAVLRFIAQLPAKAHNRLMLLTDYELLGQNKNGLDIIRQANLTYSILVTSHYLNPEVQNKAAQLNTKILPKQLASDILIQIKTAQKQKIDHNHIDAIFVDDDDLFINTLTLYLFDDHDKVLHFKSPDELKEKLNHFPKDTLIYLDNQFNSGISGIEFATWLYQQGYTRLFLLSGHAFQPNELPPYLTPILKTEINQIKKW